MLSQEHFESRRALGRRVCEEFAFIDAAGRPQVSGCMKALAALAATSPDIVLPQPRSGVSDTRPRVLDAPVPEAVGVPGHLLQVRDIAIVQVATADERALWNRLIADEHPHGVTTFAGCQVRYLVGSAHGWLGAVGFQAAALRVAARERWIGWSDEQRRDHLDRVICLSRFLVRPMVRCQNLASHVLGQILRRLPGDFEARYGYRLWLVETFVQTPRYTGAVYRASGWTRVGTTQGRGRYDRDRQSDKPKKNVWLRPLRRDWKRTLNR